MDVSRNTLGDIPILNMISFTRVPIATLVEDGEEGAKLKNLVTNNFSGYLWL